MKEDLEKDIIISESKHSMLQIIVGALCCTGAVTLFIMMIVDDSDFSDKKATKTSLGMLILSITLLVQGLRFFSIQNILFDIKNKRFKKELGIGIWKFGKWKSLPDIEYISVFKQDTSSDSDGDGRKTMGIIYNVNVWSQGSKHFTIYNNYDPEPALEMGKNIAIRLDIDLLDATIPQEKKWVEL
ncbi:hypothetical protein [uncultured Flavobacterium sp.]|uniref:hypothetical protein n=1 Tax=uncultured Flavobacterium sp. TaxID=165435 RepID=UPI0025F485F3|nr:hypothetical protein [uncultured Flavobacterium sp.]